MRNVKRLKICIFDASALTNESYSHLIMRDNSDVDIHRASCQKSRRQDLHWPVATNYFFCPRCWLRLFRCPRCLPLWGARSAEGGRRASHWGNDLSHAISIHLNPSLEQVIGPYGYPLSLFYFALPGERVSMDGLIKGGGHPHVEFFLRRGSCGHQMGGHSCSLHAWTHTRSPDNQLIICICCCCCWVVTAAHCTPGLTPGHRLVWDYVTWRI